MGSITKSCVFLLTIAFKNFFKTPINILSSFEEILLFESSFSNIIIEGKLFFIASIIDVDCANKLEEGVIPVSTALPRLSGDSCSFILPIKSLTSIHAQKHRDELDLLKKKISELEKKTPENLWLDDLESFSIKTRNRLIYDPIISNHLFDTLYCNTLILNIFHNET